MNNKITEANFINIVDAKLNKWNDPNDVPFPLAGETAQAYMLGRKDVLQWVLEMMPLDKS